MAFLRSVKSRRGIFAGGSLIKGAWTEQTAEIYSWLACGAGFIDVSLCQNLDWCFFYIKIEEEDL